MPLVLTRKTSTWEALKNLGALADRDSVERSKVTMLDVDILFVPGSSSRIKSGDFGYPPEN